MVGEVHFEYPWAAHTGFGTVAGLQGGSDKEPEGAGRTR